MSSIATTLTADRKIVVAPGEADAAVQRQKKTADVKSAAFFNKNPGGVLLSHGETPHYHRR